MRWWKVMMVLVCIQGCGVLKHGGENTRTEYVYIETEKIITDTVSVEVPKEVKTAYVPCLDTLRMGTSVAEAWAAVDTSMWMLTGGIRNKQTELTKEVQHKERTVVRDSLVYVDRVLEKEVKVEKKVVPGWCWMMMVVNMMLLVFCAYKVYRRLRSD